jgi:hypothetical protein
MGDLQAEELFGVIADGYSIFVEDERRRLNEIPDFGRVPGDSMRGMSREGIIGFLLLSK